MSDVGFPYIANTDARVLILGSMPSRKSLAQQQYYGHPQNAFWPIMGALFGFEADLPYELRLQQLVKHKIALWDVAFECVRAGSLDQAIEIDTVVVNNFAAFFATHAHIQAIFFNGRKAEQLFRKLVLQGQSGGRLESVPMHLLPSTSPAHASMKRVEKMAHWAVVKQTLESE